MTQIINKAKITSSYSLPDGSKNSNNVTTNDAIVYNLSSSFSKTRTSDTLYVVPGQEVEQTLTLINLSENDITNVRIIDSIGTGASFKEGSMTIDGQGYPDFVADYYELPNSISADGGYVVIKYKIVIDKAPTVGVITSISNIVYDFLTESDLNENSNELSLNLVNNVITIKKTSSKNAVISGDVITYTIEISNDGDVDNTDVWFEDVLAEGMSFIKGSITVDGIKYENYTLNGFSIDSLNIGEEKIITFDVIVK